MPAEKVLIVGAGVAGSVLAFYLAKEGFHVTVIERSRASQKLGQGIEIEEPALQVVKHMGILDRLKEVKTGELGFTLVDESGRDRGTLSMGSRFSATGALELMRGDFTEVLYHAADELDNVKYEFQASIRSLRDTGEKVIVEIQKRGEDATRFEEFDFVIGADGARSQTREMLFGSKVNPYKPVGAYVAYFSIPREERDWPNAKLCQFPNRRVMWLRPTRDESKVTSVYCIHLNDNLPALRDANLSADRTKQKEEFVKLFDGCGWESQRILDGMMKADNFYSDELNQVKLPKWSQGRVGLLGDSAWAPTVFTGQGNQLAIIGAWVLAQELSRNRTTVAFENYETRLRSYVEESQQIPLGGKAPYLCVPETRLGIWCFRTLFALVAWVTHTFSAKKTSESSPPASQRPERPFDLEMDASEMR